MPNRSLAKTEASSPPAAARISTRHDAAASVASPGASLALRAASSASTVAFTLSSSRSASARMSASASSRSSRKSSNSLVAAASARRRSSTSSRPCSSRIAFASCPACTFLESSSWRVASSSRRLLAAWLSTPRCGTRSRSDDVLLARSLLRHATRSIDHLNCRCSISVVGRHVGERLRMLDAISRQSSAALWQSVFESTAPQPPARERAALVFRAPRRSCQSALPQPRSNSCRLAGSSI